MNNGVAQVVSIVHSELPMRSMEGEQMYLARVRIKYENGMYESREMRLWGLDEMDVYQRVHKLYAIDAGDEW